MPTARLEFAIDTGAVELPSHARVVLLEPEPAGDLTLFGEATVRAQQSFRPAFDMFQAMGVDVQDVVSEEADIVHVTVPRSRDLARGLIAQAEALTPGGTVFVDGAKTDGIDSILKALKARVSLEGQVSKAHGKLFWFTASGQLTDWALPNPAPVKGGWMTQPGVFSVDGPDAGSEALVRALPSTLKGRGADLGGGWGYLTKHLLKTNGVSHVDLVEADKRAVDCAKLNLDSENVAIHWADASKWGAPQTLDWVVMNPPFHTSRTPDSTLGQAFIRSAARLLKPKGQLIMVANRHLPYETTLAASFVHVQELDGDSRFKILQADHPKPPKQVVRSRRR